MDEDWHENEDGHEEEYINVEKNDEDEDEDMNENEAFNWSWTGAEMNFT